MSERSARTDRLLDLDMAVGDSSELPLVGHVTEGDIDLKIPRFLGGIIFSPAAQYDRLTGLELS